MNPLTISDRSGKRPFIFVHLRLLVLVGAAIFGLQGCGGDSDSDDKIEFTPDRSDWEPGIFQDASSFVNMCEKPRSGVDPSTGEPYPDRQGLALDERNYLRSWSHETYLWYDEIQDRDPSDYNTLEYFDLLKTPFTTAAGNPKDRFHYTIPTDEYQKLTQSGVSVSYGATWSMIDPRPPREVRVAYVEAGSPAAAAGLRRGDRVLAVDGVDLLYGDNVDVLNAGLFPSEDGESHSLEMSPRDEQPDFTAQLTAAEVEFSAVPTVVDTLAGGQVGYILFNDHIATAEGELIDAVQDLVGVSDLVLDLRYNGGGYLAVASQLAYMIAGPSRTDGKAFESLVHNDKLSHWNDQLEFIPETIGFSRAEGQALPTLDLPRVFVLTSADTCSASESIINGLRGADVEVIQIGTNTCGKPYGFYPQDNCGTTYFTVQFKGANAHGFGDYADGFAPADALGSPGEKLPGCDVADDFTHDLGDPAEARLAAALNYRATDGDCGPAGSAGAQFKMSTTQSSSSSLSAVDGRVIKSPALQGRILTR
ncbi:S41 family peptidase [Gilvimarinus sp. F26214L]|uniref:S41 family peptidase n=1 Tax=Gilvimarinus sp. DZF01 TaxID=3461371 RepID=UPI0040463114